MKIQKFILLAFLVLISLGTFVRAEPEWCNVGVDVYGGLTNADSCFSMHMPSLGINETDCEIFDGMPAKEGSQVVGQTVISMTNQPLCSDTQVPFFSSVSASLAVLGAAGAYLKFKKTK